MTIKACPYCAGTAAVKDIGDGLLVRCHTCGAEGPPSFLGPDNWTECNNRAVQLWNQRAPVLGARSEDKPAVTVEMIEEIVRRRRNQHLPVSATAQEIFDLFKDKAHG